MQKKRLALVLSLVLALALLFTGCNQPKAEPKDVTVLYTNDVHCGVDQNCGYESVAGMKAALEADGKEVILVDCGDALQGDVIGTLSKGEYIIDIMNAVGYDVATLGNHEFDYGMDRFNELKAKAEFEYVSCNFVDKDGKAVLKPYKIIEAGNRKIAFVGITTPETLTSTNPANLRGEDGEYKYGFCQDETGEKLYTAVQSAVDAAKKEGADVVIAMAHLGIEKACEPWMSTDVITNTTGIDVMLDAHSHTVMEKELVKNKDGKEVLLTSTGTKLANIGCLTIGADGTFTSALTAFADETKPYTDEAAKAVVDEKVTALEDITNQVVAHTDVDLITHDPVLVDAEGKAIRLVRRQETNLGDLCADAYKAVTGADIGLVNGGGVRANIPAGDITYGQIISVHPFGNELCMKNVKGQVILDALEMSVMNVPGELGGFLQVAGLTFDINQNIPTGVKLDENSAFVGVEGERRVSNVMVNGEALDPEKIYTVASHNFLLKEGGDGFTMFMDSELLLDCIMLDNQVLITHITENLGGTVGADFADPYGQGRINFIG